MANKKNVIGEKYHMLTITGDAPSKREPSGKLVKRVYTICECGNTNESSYKNLKRGIIKSCGCLNEIAKIKVNIGDTYTYWTVLEETEYYVSKNGEKSRRFLCKCVCGKEKKVHLTSLRKGDSKSCGCLGREKKIKEEKIKTTPLNTEEEQWKESVSYSGYYVSTLGRLFNYNNQYMFPLRTYYDISFNNKAKGFMVIKEMYKTFIGEYNEETHYVYLKPDKEFNLQNIELIDKNIRAILSNKYNSMKARCNNPNIKTYKDYGARGIIIEESFNSIDKFYDWAINNGFEIGLEIDRINNNGNYSVENCRWVTKAENTRNRRVSVLNWELVDKIRYGEWKELSNYDIARKLNCSSTTIRSVRIFQTWVE